MEFAGAATPLSDTDIATVAAAMGVDAAAVHAVNDIESAGSGFLPDGRPKILFESHAFHTQTGGQYDGSHPGISTSSWVRNYGSSGAHQYDRLAEAIALNREAALKSASWGRFQIMGSNYVACGFTSVEDFVAAMVASEKAHLDAFAAFCKANHLVAPLARHDWATFARGYNGPGYAENGYDTKLAAAWAKWNAMPQIGMPPTPQPLPTTIEPQPQPFPAPRPPVPPTVDYSDVTDAIEALQTAFKNHGWYAGPIDGEWGDGTEAAFQKWQEAQG